MPLCRETQAARGGEGQRARIARDLAYHTGQIAAAQPLLQRDQRTFGRVRRDMEQAVTHIGRQSLNAGPPAQPHRRSVLHPQHLTRIFRPCLVAGR